jgi:ribosomal protein S18 acetylase RimI-like enzyme
MKIVSLIDALEWEKTLQLSYDLRKKFDSGESSLNNYLQNHARQSDKQNISRPWILIDDKNNLIAGFITLSNTSIEKMEIVDQFKTNINPVPSLLIGRLAIDLNYRKQGLGEKLLMFAFEKAREINKISALQAIVVDTLNEDAQTFYERFSFKKIGSSNKMMISMKELF